LEGYSCQLVVDEAIQWLDSFPDQDQPFYINVWFNEPHERVAAPAQLAQRHSYLHEYYGCIENMDAAVGRLLSYLKEQNLENNTIVIFTSDNGSAKVASNDPLRGEKTFNYEGGIRVPFLLRWPDRTPAGVTAETTGSFTDILPTISRLTGTAVPGDRKLDGEDLSEVFRDSDDPFNRSSPVFFFRYFHDPVCMLREGNWVLLGFQGEPFPYLSDYNQSELANLKPDPANPSWSMWGFQPKHMQYLKTAVPVNFELFDIKEDIYQKKDLSSAHPEIVTRMKRRMLDLRQEMIEEGGDWYQ
jgi:arylsulfatase A